MNGWDLQHARRVRWSRFPEAYRSASPVFGANPARCSRTWKKRLDLRQRLRQVAADHWQTRPPSVAGGGAVSRRRAGGVAGDCRADRHGPTTPGPELSGTIRGKTKWSRTSWCRSCVRSVGRRNDRVKWRYIDVAVFRALPRTAENCHLVIEAKRLGCGRGGRSRSGQGIRKALGVLRDVVVTDGIRYRMYAADRAFAPWPMRISCA